MMSRTHNLDLLRDEEPDSLQSLEEKIYKAVDLVNLLRQEKTALQEELEAPTLKWKHRVKFAKYIRYGYPKTILIRVTTTDEVYGYQDQGTKAHMVKPKRAKALAWTSKAGSRLFSKGHRVRGVKAQHWTNKAKRKYQPRIKRLADELMEDVARDF